LIHRPDDPADAGRRWRHRFVENIRHWTQRRLERRLQAEWEDWRRSAEVRPRWFRRQSTPLRTQNFRSLVQVNFYRAPPR
jgi:hypothetical protein